VASQIHLSGCAAVDAFRDIQSPCECDFLCCAATTIGGAASHGSLEEMVTFFLLSNPGADFAGALTGALLTAPAGRGRDPRCAVRARE
jgi:hypothetical protein